jgi:hypothetical protein
MQKLLEGNASVMEDELSLAPVLEQATFTSCFSEASVMQSLEGLTTYVRERNYEGIDLFDGLNSKLFRATPLYQSALFRLALIQFCKQSPLNFRPLFLVPPGFNAKAGALFLLGNINLLRHTGEEIYANEAYILFQRLKHTCITRKVGIGWGYNFDWQARAFFVPQGTPNMVTSVYVGRALLAYHQQFNDPEALSMALKIVSFILDEMIHYEDANTLCFNYIPGKDAEVHNANLLGAAFLAQTLPHFPEARQEAIRQKILKAARFSVSDISVEGAWPYGTKPFHRWMDNFHTGYNIECLVTISHMLGTDEFMSPLFKVLEYYLAHLFTEEGLPKYYDKALYPIDVHVLAEVLILWQLLRKSNMAWFPERMAKIERVMLDLVDRFQDPQKGYFYYQRTAQGWNRIPYMRWGQAWMFYALSSCL